MEKGLSNATQVILNLCKLGVLGNLSALFSIQRRASRHVRQKNVLAVSATTFSYLVENKTM
jgi:hypothetical protein